LLPFVASIGKAKMISAQKRLETVADHFFNILQNLPDEITGADGSDNTAKNSFWEIKGKQLFINRVMAEKAIREAEFPLDYPERLGNSLQEHPAYVESKTHRFPGIKDKPVNCMIFNLDRLFE
jgi:hypothetical protein